MELTIKIESKSVYEIIMQFLKSIDVKIVKKRGTSKFESLPEKGLKLSDFSFEETQKLLKDFKGSFSKEVIAERRSSL